MWKEHESDSRRMTLDDSMDASLGALLLAWEMSLLSRAHQAMIAPIDHRVSQWVEDPSRGTPILYCRVLPKLYAETNRLPS